MSLLWVIIITMVVLFIAGAAQARRSGRHPRRFIDSPEWQKDHLRFKHERERAAQEHALEDHL
jgi:hypothetical protein